MAGTIGMITDEELKIAGGGCEATWLSTDVLQVVVGIVAVRQCFEVCFIRPGV